MRNRKSIHRNSHLILLFGVLAMITACDRSIEYPAMPASRGSVDIISEIESNRSLAAGVHPKMSGLMTFLDLMQKSDASVVGDNILEAIDHFNPGFSDENEDIYEGLGKIGTVFNHDGKLYLTTADDAELDVDKMRVRSGSRLVKSPESTGQKVLLLVEEGVTVGWKFIQFDLNYIVVDAVSGDITFNYGNDKSETMNIIDIIKE